MGALKGQAKIEARSVSRVYNAGTAKQIEALRGVSFSLEPSEFLAVVGPSGCGKSTLLSILAGLSMPTSGEVLYDGRPISGPGPERGVMFQDYALFPWKTVRANIEFGPVAVGLGRRERQARVAELIHMVELDGFEDKYPRELSGGMQQRCALARMLANRPEVWLLDEPLAALDLQTRLIIQDELLRLWGDDRPRGERKAAVLVTHGIEEAVYLADRVLVLDRRPGRVRDVVEVDLPRPRAPHRNSARAREITDHIWQEIQGSARQAIIEEVA